MKPAKMKPARNKEIELENGEWLPAPTGNPFAERLRTEGSETHVTDDAVTIVLPNFTSAQLREVRTRLGLTQRQFGVALGYGRKGAAVRISEFEGGAQPIPSQVSILARYMDTHGLLTPSANESENDYAEQFERELAHAVTQAAVNAGRNFVKHVIEKKPVVA